MRDHELYAQAFFEACGDDILMYYQAFTKVVELLNNLSNLKEFKLLDTSRPEKVNKFLWVLVQDGMMSQLNDIHKSIRKVLIGEGLWNYCVIESAQVLEESVLDRIKEILRTENTVHTEYETKVNPDLKAGFRIYFNDEVIDLSVAGRLDKLLKGVYDGQS